MFGIYLEVIDLSASAITGWECLSNRLFLQDLVPLMPDSALNYRTGSGSDLAVSPDSTKGPQRDIMDKAQDSMNLKHQVELFAATWADSASSQIQGT